MIPPQRMEPAVSDNAKPATDPSEQRRKKRIVGVDAARGLALVGMIAVHVLPIADSAGEPTLVWTAGAGVAAALFAFLAGVSLSLSSGGSRPVQGRAMNGARIGTAVRAVVLIVLGMLLAILDPPAGIILTYYGVMFLLAIPLLAASPRRLFGAAAAFAVLGGTLLHFVSDQWPGLEGYDPSFATLISQPGATLAAVFATGTYPALAWTAFICAGMAVGRMNLRSQDTQLRLAVSGLVVAVTTWLVSTAMITFLGGFDRILFSTPSLSEWELIRSLTWGTSFSTPDINSGWWLFVMSPYSETPLEMLNTLGLAIFAFGAMVWIGSKVGWLVTPLALVGSMTLTVYSAHLLFIATDVLDELPYVSFWLQVGGSLLFVVLWRNVAERTQGPLEWVMTRAANKARDQFLATPTKT